MALAFGRVVLVEDMGALLAFVILFIVVFFSLARALTGEVCRACSAVLMCVEARFTVVAATARVIFARDVFLLIDGDGGGMVSEIRMVATARVRRRNGALPTAPPARSPSRRMRMMAMMKIIRGGH